MIEIISTGGTIDSSPDYDPSKKSVFSGSNILKLLQDARISESDYRYYPLFQKDSADITKEDRQLILDTCKASGSDKILITHGTDIMCETALYLGENQTNSKTIVLVGSFVPASQPENDAVFNLGFAFAAAQILKPGVFITIGGQIFDWDNVIKNFVDKKFETKH